MFMLKQRDRLARYSCRKQDICKFVCFDSRGHRKKKSMHSYWNFKDPVILLVQIIDFKLYFP